MGKCAYGNGMITKTEALTKQHKLGNDCLVQP